MTEKSILTTIEEFTKYFDVCYWKERRKNPNSPKIKNWTAEKRKKALKHWFGEDHDN